MLRGKLNDLVTLVKADGTVVKENIKAMVQPKTIFMDDETLPIEPGDHLLHKLPSGLVADYLVVDPGFFPENFTRMPAHFQTKVQRSSSGNQPASTTIHNITNNYTSHVTGDNARVNINSVDNSSNYASAGEVSPIFEQLKELLGSSDISDTDGQNIRLSIEKMEAAQTKQGFMEGYQSFMGHAANHITVFAPLLPALAGLLT